jgi:hypothetical protein
MKHLQVRLLFCLLPLLLIGCASLSRTEKGVIRELESYGIPSDTIQVKDSTAAGFLNILPGFGNFYLALDTDEHDEWLYGGLNLVTWPVSILWGVPQGYNNATILNQRETAYFYKFDPEGKRQIERRRQRRLD